MSEYENVPSKKYQLLHWVNSYGSIPSQWQFRRIGDLFEERSEFSSDQVNYPLCSFTIEQGVTPKTERYERSFLLRDAETNEYKIVRRSDLIFNPMNIRFGAVDIYNGEPPVSVSAYYTIASPVSAEVDLRFLRMYLKSSHMLDVYHRIALGSLIEKRRVHWSMLRDIYIAIPSFAEQKRIADLLCTWDRAIEVLDNLIAANEQQMEGLKRCVLTGNLRLAGFKKQWSTKRLGDLGVFSKGSGISRDQVLGMGLPGVPYGDIYTRHNNVIRKFDSFISQETANTSKKIVAGDLLFTASGETPEEIGKCVAFLGDHDAYAGGDVIVMSVQKGDPTFLAYLLNHKSVVRQKVSFAQGHSIVHISATNLAKLRLHIPDKDEQAAIGSLLNNLDQRNHYYSNQKASLETEKRALMQQLLTGRRRVSKEDQTTPVAARR